MCFFLAAFVLGLKDANYSMKQMLLYTPQHIVKAQLNLLIMHTLKIQLYTRYSVFEKFNRTKLPSKIHVEDAKEQASDCKHS